MSFRNSRTMSVVLTTLVLLPACSNDPAAPSQPESEEIVLTDQLHHLGDNAGAEGAEFTADFQVAEAFDSASVSITFLSPNPLGVSGPAVDYTQLFVNAMQIGITPGDFPDEPACIGGTASHREYSCDATIVLAATQAVAIGNNSIRVTSEPASGDDFVFRDLIVTVWR
jgi:hypothetical protein